MFPPDDYDKLDPSYREALGKLESELQQPFHRQAQNDLMDFAEKNMISQKLWDEVFYESRFGSRYRSSIKLYFFKESFDRKKCYDSRSFGPITHNDVGFPHKDLDKRMEWCESNSYAFIPQDIRQRYEDMKALYLKIKEAEDTDRWFETLLEANDHQFVRENIEYKLGDDLTDKNLWKKYINYLKEHNDKILLQTYSKYCRFFIDDAEMKEEYRQAAAKTPGVNPVPWTNPYDFEVYDPDFWVNDFKDEEARRRHRYSNIAMQVDGGNVPMPQFNGQNAAKPPFPFEWPTIRHILENANAEVLQKLYKTCKWFYAFHPVAICYKFIDIDNEGDNAAVIIGDSIKSYNNSFLRTNIPKLYIATSLEFVNSDPNSLSNLFKFCRCFAKYIKISRQNLSMEELQSIIGHGNVVHLNLDNVGNSDGSKFKLEDVLQFTPKIRCLLLTGFECTAETSQKLCEMKFANKLEEIFIDNLKSNLLDPEKFSEFIIKNCCSSSRIFLQCDHENTTLERVTQFKDILSAAINQHWMNEKKPMFGIL